jgi:predicted MFS family arabinose efflux permease
MSVHFVIALTLFNMASVRAGRVLLTLYAIKLGAHPVAIGMLAASFSVIPILFSWASGRWVDRFGSRWLLLIGVIGTASGMLLPYFAPSLATIFIAGLLSGLSITFCNVSLQNLVGLMSAPENRARNFGNYTLAGSTAAFIGPLIAGFSIDHAGYDYTCLIVVAIAIVPVSMLVMRGGALPGGSREAKPAGNLWHAMTLPGVWPVLAASCVAQTAGDFFQFYMPVYAHDAGLSPSAIGIVLAAYSAATFVARIFLPGLIQRWSEQKLLVYAFVLSGFALMLVPVFHSAALLAPISFLIGLGMGCTAPITMMLMFTRSAEGRSGEAMGLRLTADNITRFFGPVLFGMIASAAGLAAVFWLNALMLGSGSLFAGRSGARHPKD